MFLSPNRDIGVRDGEPPARANDRVEVVRDQITSCTKCQRLRTYCAEIARTKKAAHREDVYWGRPVPGFGDPNARVLVLGLAPAAHGANRTGRVFTGDGSGDFLMRAMHAAGFANITTSQRTDDGLALNDAYILSAVRCAPPDNKPTPAEIAECHPHLVAEVAALPNVKVIVALGKIGFDAAWRLLAAQGIAVKPKPPSRHGGCLRNPAGPTVIGVIPPQPAEHQHEEAHAAHVGGGIPPRRDVRWAPLKGLTTLGSIHVRGMAEEDFGRLHHGL